MINYNYRLGYMIDRLALKHVFDQQEGWTARYDPRLDPNVSIQIPYEVPENQRKMRKKGRVHCHTFMVNKSGVITQSGPTETLIEDAYLKFMHIIETHKDQFYLKS
jgi:hypothetical protein